jgi:hypothetical protein
MESQSKIRHLGGRGFLVLAMLIAPVSARGQQTYVTRFDIYTGYTFLDSPHTSLFTNGFHFQAGVRPSTHYSVGFDYSISAGDFTLTPDLLTTSLQQQLGAQLAQLIAMGVIPPNYSLVVRSHSRTQTFAAGPQLAYRHFSTVTLFVRPFIGAVHVLATPHPSDPVATAIVKQLAPSGEKTDTAPFYGFGGGVDFLFSKHFALRVQSDLVYQHVFSDLLKDGQWTMRFSVGPAFNFGKNISKAVSR